MGSDIVNSVAKWGLILGVVMSASRIVEANLIISADVANYTMLTFEWIFAAAIYIVMLYRINRARSEGADPAVGYRFAQSLNYTIMISIFAAIIVGISYHTYIVNYVGGYDRYLELSLNSIESVLAGSELSADAMALLDQGRESVALVRSDPPSIISTIFSTIATYILSGFIVGLGVAMLTKRNAEIKSDEE